jgi:hypothetical protein
MLDYLKKLSKTEKKSVNSDGEKDECSICFGYFEKSSEAGT